MTIIVVVAIFAALLVTITALSVCCHIRRRCSSSKDAVQQHTVQQHTIRNDSILNDSVLDDHEATFSKEYSYASLSGSTEGFQMSKKNKAYGVLSGNSGSFLTIQANAAYATIVGGDEQDHIYSEADYV